MDEPSVPPPTLTERLAAVLGRPVGPGERERAALHLLDWAGCALAGAVTPQGRAMAAVAGAHPFALAGAGTEGAVAALGGLGSLLEMDDVHRGALLHPGPAVVPVILGSGGAGDALAAMVRGYEAMIRLGRAVGPGHYAFFHNTSTCGGLGAAVAAAGMAGGGGDTLVGAMGHALSLAAGLWQCRHEDVATKHLHVAEAARRGLSAARYAMAGLGGPRSILEGPQGFFAALARDGDPARVAADPGAAWAIHEVSFKPWPACRHAHPAIDAALSLRDRLAGETPLAVRVGTYADAIRFCDRPLPRTPAEARFSLQHAVAVALQEGPPPLAAFEEGRLDAVADLRARVSVAVDPGLSAAYPAHFGATVTVTTARGSLSATVADAWGDSENPMDAAAIRAKYDALAAAAGLPSDTSGDLAGAILALPAGGPLADIQRIMRRIGAAATRTSR
jgi:2-methylcitrate dehydratase PrpD